jgi:3-oxoacyl-(acyl-carrier-protein) synthase
VNTCPEPSAPPTQNTAWCAVVGHGCAAAEPETVSALRRRYGNPILKQSDEQTLAALAAVHQAIDSYRLDAASFSNWGSIAGPRFLGRASMVVALRRFAEEGAWGISPHMIPHHSLHSVSGTISQALRMHGPNFGAGGGPEAASEAMLTAAALLSAGQAPGLWVVLTHCCPDPSTAFADARAVALALTSVSADWRGPCLEVGALPADDATWAPFDPDQLAQALVGARPACWRLGCGGWLRVHPAASPGEGES